MFFGVLLIVCLFACLYILIYWFFVMFIDLFVHLAAYLCVDCCSCSLLVRWFVGLIAFLACLPVGLVVCWHARLFGKVGMLNIGC